MSRQDRRVRWRAGCAGRSRWPRAEGGEELEGVVGAGQPRLSEGWSGSTATSSTDGRRWLLGTGTSPTGARGARTA